MRILPFMPLSDGEDTPFVDLNKEEGVRDNFHSMEGKLESLGAYCFVEAGPLTGTKAGES